MSRHSARGSRFRLGRAKGRKMAGMAGKLLPRILQGLDDRIRLSASRASKEVVPEMESQRRAVLAIPYDRLMSIQLGEEGGLGSRLQFARTIAMGSRHIFSTIRILRMVDRP